MKDEYTTKDILRLCKETGKDFHFDKIDCGRRLTLKLGHDQIEIMVVVGGIADLQLRISVNGEHYRRVDLIERGLDALINREIIDVLKTLENRAINYVASRDQSRKDVNRSSFESTLDSLLK